jgi:hypothetical protein
MMYGVAHEYADRHGFLFILNLLAFRFRTKKSLFMRRDNFHYLLIFIFDYVSHQVKINNALKIFVDRRMVIKLDEYTCAVIWSHGKVINGM